MITDADATTSIRPYTVVRPKMGQRFATASANTRAIIGDRIQTAMSASATPESLKRHARNIKTTETMVATSAAVKAVVRRIGFSEFISLTYFVIRYQRSKKTGASAARAATACSAIIAKAYLGRCGNHRI